MKKINLILEQSEKFKIADLKEGEEYKVSTNLISKAIQYFQIQSQGLNLSQQRQAIKIMDKLEDCESGTLELEDAEYTFLKNIFDTVKWPEHMRAFTMVADNIENPIKQDPKSE